MNLVFGMFNEKKAMSNPWLDGWDKMEDWSEGDEAKEVLPQ